MEILSSWILNDYQTCHKIEPSAGCHQHHKPDQWGCQQPGPEEKGLNQLCDLSLINKLSLSLLTGCQETVGWFIQEFRVKRVQGRKLKIKSLSCEW